MLNRHNGRYIGCPKSPPSGSFTTPCSTARSIDRVIKELPTSATLVPYFKGPLEVHSRRRRPSALPRHPLSPFQPPFGSLLAVTLAAASPDAIPCSTEIGGPQLKLLLPSPLPLSLSLPICCSRMIDFSGKGYFSRPPAGCTCQRGTVFTVQRELTLICMQALENGICILQ